MMLMTIGCAKKASTNDAASGGGGSGTQYIYVSSGTVFAGIGITPAISSKTIAKYTLDGQFVSVVKDYTSSSADSPVDILSYDSTRLISLVENSTGRKVEYIDKTSGSATSIFSNIANLNGIVRSFYLDYSGQFVIAKSSGIEKMQFSGSQTTGPSGGPFIGAATCGAGVSNTAVMAVTPAPSGFDFVIAAHGAASPSNKIFIIKKTGYGAAADCLAYSAAAPTVNHIPTALLMHSSGVLFVSFSSSTGNTHQIYAFTPTFTATTATFPAWPATPALNDLAYAKGISKMAEMPDGSILVASADPTMNVIERFTYDSSTGLLSRVGSAPFLGPSVFTKSVSGLIIAD